jgi:tRNA-2-methylthio-N6-dimethylallyladenosine synthase
VTARVTHAAPHHLVADEVLDVRRTRGGDAWDRAQAASCGVPAPAGQAAGAPRAVSLGLPTLRVGV